MYNGRILRKRHFENIYERLLTFELNCRNSLDYKDDMDAAKFEEFLHELCQKLKEKYGDKVAIIMDNASYHSVLVRFQTSIINNS